MRDQYAQNVVTLIASQTLKPSTVLAAREMLAATGADIEETQCLEPDLVVDIRFEGDIELAKLALVPLLGSIDIAVQPIAHRRKKLLISDMDSTMITVECIDELADYAGIKAEIAAVTERAMLGELDFVEGLRARVKLLAGLDQAKIQQCLEERVKIMAGAEILVRTMAKWGAHTILISGGFTQFARPVASKIGFAEVHANELALKNGVLTGDVTGKIIDARAKKAQLVSSALEFGLNERQTLAVGDGANDIPMIETAGFGVAYHAKPKAADAADFAVRHGDLTTLLYAQGVARAEWECN
jgi:phosphoserine phosphatase